MISDIYNTVQQIYERRIKILVALITTILVFFIGFQIIEAAKQLALGI